ncbi:MAG: Holliday junction branch migration protein RuvA [Leucobacter sp.]|nr:Holliday junction branch migration protein RuvA [Leucobacter sp.]
MIASIRGAVLAAGPGWVVIDVGGIGYRVEVPGRLSGAHVGAQLALHTSLVVREDALTLYGFESQDELEVFGVLLSVSGVGPRSALGVLTELTPSQIAQAIASEDEKPFRKAPGIGPKTAKLIAVQLAGKLDPRMFSATGDAAHPTPDDSLSGDDRVAVNVATALMGLGYAESQALLAVDDARAAGAAADESGLLRAALALLQQPRAGGRHAGSEQGGGAR